MVKRQIRMIKSLYISVVNKNFCTVSKVMILVETYCTRKDLSFY